MEAKAQEKYEEWTRSKKKENKEKQRNTKEEKLKANRQYVNKICESEIAYKQWLTKAKKKKNNRNTYAYSGGSLFSYYDMGCTPPPSYVNPNPWVDFVATDYKPSDIDKFSSPPLMWKDIDKRERPLTNNSKQKKKVIVKHSCANMMVK